MVEILNFNQKESNSNLDGNGFGSGEMKERILTFDWSKTAVGSPDKWPQSLRTAISIIISSKFPMFLWWGDDLIQFYNDAYRPSLGINGKHPMALGQRGEECWPEIWPIIKPLIDQVRSGGGPTWSEDQLIPIYRNGKIEDVYWTFSYSPVNDESGAVGGVLVVCNETTEKINNLKKLEESKDQLQFAIEATELGTWDYNPFTNKFTGNNRLKEWFGLGYVEEVDLNLVLNIIAEKERKSVFDAIQHALQFSSGGHYDIEYTIIHPVTHKSRIVKAKGKAWFNDDKIAYRFNGTLEDITAETLAKRELSELAESSFKKFEKIANTLPQIVWTATPDGGLDYFNNQWFIYSGLNYEKSVGQGWASTIHPEDLPRLSEIWANSLVTGLPYQVEARIKSGENIYNWALIRALALRNDDNRIAQWCGTCTLIQDQKESEQHLLDLSRELAAANNEIQVNNQDLINLNNQLVRVNSDMDNFIYTASHDLKAPISNIEGLVIALTRYMSKESLANPMIIKLLSMIKASIDRFKKTIQDLTEITKLQRLTQDEETNVDLEEIINDIQLDLLEIIKESNGQIKLELDCVRELRFSPKNLRSILYNLISNGLKYKSSERSPVIQINCKEDQDFFVLTVQDNGLGIDVSNRNSIFGMFKRLHNHVEGSGIGLFIVKKILDNAGGRIEVESEVGEGSIFKLFFKKSLVINDKA